MTTRTAGFNTLEIGAIHDSTALMSMALMVIGAGSTSTAGGIKVTTFVVLLLATVAFFRRREPIHAFGRSLGHEEVMRCLRFPCELPHGPHRHLPDRPSHDGEFLDPAFEVTSAFGTVGLSRGATGDLDAFGRAIIMALMFIGPVGPLTLGLFLATRVSTRISYPSSRVFLG